MTRINRQIYGADKVDKANSEIKKSTLLEHVIVYAGAIVVCSSNCGQLFRSHREELFSCESFIRIAHISAG